MVQVRELRVELVHLLANIRVWVVGHHALQLQILLLQHGNFCQVLVQHRMLRCKQESSDISVHHFAAFPRQIQQRLRLKLISNYCGGNEKAGCIRIPSQCIAK
jgi:hypothetical protein